MAVGSRDDDVQLCIWSAAKQHSEEQIIADKRQRFENELTHLKAGLSQKRRLEAYDKVLDKIGHLRERHSLVSHHDDMTVTPNAKQQALDLTWYYNQAAAHRDRRLGTTILYTDGTIRMDEHCKAKPCLKQVNAYGSIPPRRRI